MKSWGWRGVRSVALASALVGLTSAAFAGPLTGSLTLILGGLPPIGITGSGTGTSTTGSVTVSASAFATVGATAPGTTPFVSKVILTATNAAGAFSGPTLQGPMAIRGRARLLNGGLTAFSIPLTVNATRGVGLGGAAIQTSTLAITGGTWSAGLVQITGLGTAALPYTVSLAGSDLRTAMGAGTLTLVTPIRIKSTSLGAIGAFGVLQLSFVPEPSAAALLLGAGAAALAGMRRVRRGR
jgi:hypothetical protein